MCFLWVFFIFVRQEGGSFYGVLFFCLSASFLVLVGGAAVVGTLPLLVRFPRLALMGILTPVWVVVLWTIAERAHVYLCVFWLRFDLDAGYALEDMRAATSGGTQAALANVAHLAAATARRLDDSA